MPPRKKQNESSEISVTITKTCGNQYGGFVRGDTLTLPGPVATELLNANYAVPEVKSLDDLAEHGVSTSQARVEKRAGKRATIEATAKSVFESEQEAEREQAEQAAIEAELAEETATEPDPEETATEPDAEETATEPDSEETATESE